MTSTSWRPLSLTLISCCLAALQVSPIQSADDFPTKERVVDVKLLVNETTNTAELTWRKQHDFATGPLNIPFADPATLTVKDVLLFEGKRVVENYETRVDKVSPGGKPETYTLVVTAPKAKRVNAEVRVTVSGIKEKPFSVSYQALAAAHPQSLLLALSLENKTYADWSAEGEPFTLELRNKDKTEFSGAIATPLAKDGKRSVLLPLSTRVDAETVNLDISAADLKSQVGLPLKRTLRLENVPSSIAPDKQLSPAMSVTLLKDSKIELRGNPSALTFPWNRTLTLSAELPLGIDSSCGDCGCDSPCNPRGNVTDLVLGTDESLFLKSLSVSATAPWIPLAIVNGELHYLNGSEVEACIVNMGTGSRKIRFLSSSGGSLTSDAIFEALPGVLNVGPQAQERSNKPPRAWRFACEVQKVSLKMPPKEISLTKLKENLLSLKEVDDKLLRPIFYLQADAKKAIVKEGLEKHIDALKNQLVDVALSLECIQRSQQQIAAIEQSQKLYRGIESRLKTSTGSALFSQQLTRTENVLNELTKKKTQTQEQLDLMLAEWYWKANKSSAETVDPFRSVSPYQYDSMVNRGYSLPTPKTNPAMEENLGPPTRDTR